MAQEDRSDVAAASIAALLVDTEYVLSRGLGERPTLASLTLAHHSPAIADDLLAAVAADQQRRCRALLQALINGEQLPPDWNAYLYGHDQLHEGDRSAGGLGLPSSVLDREQPEPITPALRPAVSEFVRVNAGRRQDPADSGSDPTETELRRSRRAVAGLAALCLLLIGLLAGIGVSLAFRPSDQEVADVAPAAISPEVSLPTADSTTTLPQSTASPPPSPESTSTTVDPVVEELNLWFAANAEQLDAYLDWQDQVTSKLAGATSAEHEAQLCFELIDEFTDKFTGRGEWSESILDAFVSMPDEELADAATTWAVSFALALDYCSFLEPGSADAEWADAEVAGAAMSARLAELLGEG